MSNELNFKHYLIKLVGYIQQKDGKIHRITIRKDMLNNLGYFLGGSMNFHKFEVLREAIYERIESYLRTNRNLRMNKRYLRTNRNFCPLNDKN